MSPLRPLRPVPLLLALSLIVAACTGSGLTDPTTPEPAPTSTSTPTASTDAPRSTPEGPGRLVIIDATGAVVTMRPDGSERTTLTDAATDRLQFSQPTWSPEGEHLVWTEVDARGAAPSYTLVTARHDGSNLTRAAMAFPPFYLYWNPAGTGVAYLGTGASSLEIGLLDVAGGGTEAATIDTGQPYYFAWDGDGDRLLVHVGTERLEWLDLDGTITALPQTPGFFQAPALSPDGERLVFASRDAEGDRLVVADPEGGVTQTIADHETSALFVLSPDGRRLAYQVNDSRDDVITAFGATAALVSQPLAQAPPAGLSVADLDEGGESTITAEPALAFSWDPGSTRLLTLLADLTGPQARFRWHVWDTADETSVTFEPFVPSLRMVRDYLPFFDQYAQSVSYWAPDGSAFAYAGTNDSGEPGIWIQPVAPDSAASKVADGDFVAWSP